MHVQHQQSLLMLILLMSNTVLASTSASGMITDSSILTDVVETVTPSPIPTRYDITAGMNTDAMITSADVRGNHSANPAKKIPIYLAGFFSLGGGWDGSGILPAVEMALEHINKRSDILAEYELKMVWNDSQCDAGLGTRVLFDHLYRDPQKLMILGPACSTAAQAVAATAYHWNLVTLSYSASSSQLSDMSKYPYFYRTCILDAMYNPARIRLIEYFNWTRVATIHENHELFSLAIDDLLTLLRQANVTVITSESFSENPRNQVINLKEQDARIIFANMYEIPALRLFCEAYNEGLIGEGYVWFILGWYKDGWYLKENIDEKILDSLTCSLDQLKEAVESSLYISTEGMALIPGGTAGISGLTTANYIEAITARMSLPKYEGYTMNAFAPYGYDAVWAAALMLNRSAEILSTDVLPDGKRRRLEDFTYDDRHMVKLFLSILSEIEFDGITGPVSFNSGDRIGITSIEQLQPMCPASGQFMGGSWCLAFVDLPLSWEMARNACVVADGNGILAPLKTAVEIEQMLETWMKWKEQGPHNMESRWYLGLSRDAIGQLWQTSERGESHLELVTENATVIIEPIISSASSGCVIVDFNSTGKLQVVHCEKKHPFICAGRSVFREKQIGLYRNLKDELELEEELLWPGDGTIPMDRTPEIQYMIRDVYMGIDINLYIVMTTLAFLGILMAAFFFAFNVKFRNQKFVKLSSPNLNNLIILGSVMVYSWIFLYGLDSNLLSDHSYRIICQARNWIISLGFVIAFGAMFSKTWRVHRVASFKVPKRRVIRDTQLYLIVFVLTLLDFIILLLWQTIDPMALIQKQLYERSDPENEFMLLRPYIKLCHCNHLTIWLGLTYGYKGLLLILGTFLAWETRKVTIPALNDSKLIGISVYNVVILCTIGAGVSFALDSDPATLFMFVSLIAVFCTSITLFVVFVPKIVSVNKDPAGGNATSRRSTTNIATIDNMNSRSGETPTPGELMRDLEQKIEELEAKLKEARNAENILKDTGKNACGLWCFGSYCGCSPTEGFFHLDVEHNAAKYTLRHDNNGNISFSSGADALSAENTQEGSNCQEALDVPEGPSPIHGACVLGVENEGYDTIKEVVAPKFELTVPGSSNSSPAIM